MKTNTIQAITSYASSTAFLALGLAAMMNSGTVEGAVYAVGSFCCVFVAFFSALEARN